MSIPEVSCLTGQCVEPYFADHTPARIASLSVEFVLRLGCALPADGYLGFPAEIISRHSEDKGAAQVKGPGSTERHSHSSQQAAKPMRTTT